MKFCIHEPLARASAADNPLFRRVLEEFDRLTSVPCVLNTSLNSHGKPLCASAEDALSCFGRTGLRLLFLGRVDKPEADLLLARGVLGGEPQGSRGVTAGEFT